MKKRASLSLSIEAIVIIILAITLLGLGLTFMRQFIGKGSEQLGSILDISKLDQPATINEPITAKETINVQIEKPSELTIGFYCDSPSECQVAKPAISTCDKAFNVLTTINPVPTDLLTSPTINVPSHSSIGFKAILAPLQQGNYICTLSFGGSESWKKQKQIYIEVA